MVVFVVSEANFSFIFTIHTGEWYAHLTLGLRAQEYCFILFL